MANKNTNTVTVNFEVEKVTKNTIRFAEKIENDDAVIGTLYVKKSALSKIGYTDGKKLCVSIAAK